MQNAMHPPSSAHMKALTGAQPPPQPAPAFRKALESIDTSIAAVQTALIQLSPAFMASLRQVAPKKRRARVPYVLAAGVLFFLIALLGDRSTRAFALDRGHDLLAKGTVSSAPVRAEAAPEPATSAPEAATAPPPTHFIQLATIDLGEVPAQPTAASAPDPTVEKPVKDARLPAPKAARNTARRGGSARHAP